MDGRVLGSISVTTLEYSARPTVRQKGEKGQPWDLPDLHFDREQYIAEIKRASSGQILGDQLKQPGLWTNVRSRPASVQLPILPDITVKILGYQYEL